MHVGSGKSTISLSMSSTSAVWGNILITAAKRVSQLWQYNLLFPACSSYLSSLTLCFSEWVKRSLVNLANCVLEVALLFFTQRLVRALIRAESLEANALNHKSFCPSSVSSKYWAVISSTSCVWTLAGSIEAGFGEPRDLNDGGLALACEISWSPDWWKY